MLYSVVGDHEGVLKDEKVDNVIARQSRREHFLKQIIFQALK